MSDMIDRLMASTDQAARANEVMLIGRFLEREGRQASPETRHAFAMVRAKITLGDHRKGDPA